MDRNASSHSAHGQAEAAVDGSLMRWTFANAVLDESRLELTVNGVRKPLARHAVQVLRCLLQHANEVVAKDALREAVWPGRAVSDAIVSRAVTQVRAALREAPQVVVCTVHGLGYRLEAAAEARPLGACAATRASPSGDALVRHLRRDLRRYQVAAAGLLLVVLALIGFRQAGDAQRDTSAAGEQALPQRATARHQGWQEARLERQRADAVRTFLQDELLGRLRHAPQPRSVDFQAVVDVAARRIDTRLQNLPLAAGDLHMLFGLELVTPRTRAIPHLESAVAHYAAAGQAGRAEVLAARILLADGQMHSGRYASGRSHAEEASRQAAVTLGEESCLSILARGQAATMAAHAGAVVRAMAELRRLIDRAESCRAPGRDGMVIARHVLPVHHLDLVAAQVQARLNLDYAWISRLARSDLDAGEVSGRRALQLMQELHGEQDQRTVLPRRRLAVLLLLRGKTREAEGLLAEADAIVASVAHPDGAWRASAARDRGLLALERRDAEGARILLGQSVSLCPDFAICPAAEVMESHESLAEAALELGALGDAIAHYRRALALRSETHGASHPWTLISRAGLALALARDGHPAQAEEVLGAIDAAALAELPADSLHTARLNLARAEMARQQGDHEGRRKALARAHAQLIAGLGTEHWRVYFVGLEIAQRHP